jgi:hypothetical protein
MTLAALFGKIGNAMMSRGVVICANRDQGDDIQARMPSASVRSRFYGLMFDVCQGVQRLRPMVYYMCTPNWDRGAPIKSLHGPN